MKKKIFVVVGPTASGKSGLAIQIAKHINGQIVNADSMQIYHDLSIISARPQQEDLDQVPHHLYGYVDAWTQPSVQDWLSVVVPKLKEVSNPVLVGGTGLYVSALINGLNDIPEIDPEIRATVRQMDMTEIQSRLKDCPFTDPQRMKRALEVELSTGHCLAYFQSLPKKKLYDADFRVIFLNPPRNQLYQNCEERFNQMMEQGGVEEVRHLLTLNPTGGVLKAIGVPEITAFLRGDIFYETMKKKAILATRHYAKRQVTWFRHQLNYQYLFQSKKDFDFSILK